MEVNKEKKHGFVLSKPSTLIRRDPPKLDLFSTEKLDEYVEVYAPVFVKQQVSWTIACIQHPFLRIDSKLVC